MVLLHFTAPKQRSLSLFESAENVLRWARLLFELLENHDDVPRRVEELKDVEHLVTRSLTRSSMR